MIAIGDEFDMKDNEDKQPNCYLGTNIVKFEIKDGRFAWSIKSGQHEKAAVETMKALDLRW